MPYNILMCCECYENTHNIYVLIKCELCHRKIVQDMTFSSSNLHEPHIKCQSTKTEREIYI